MFIRSASVQSHHSQPRHRDPRPSHATILSSDATRDFPLSLTRGPLKDTLPPVVDGPLPRPLFWSNSFGWILSGYIIISLAFFSVSLYHGYCTSLSPSLQTSTTLQTPSPTVSRIDVLSPATRLAKLVSLYLPPTHFGPFAYRPLVDPHPHEVTACLWASESNLDWVPSWTNDWLGNPPARSLLHSHIVNRSDLPRSSDPPAPRVEWCSRSSRVETSSPSPNAQRLPPCDARASFGSNDPRGAQYIPQPRAPVCVHTKPASRPWDSKATAIIFHSIFVHNASTRTCHRARGGAGTRNTDPCRQEISRALPYTYSSRSHIVVCGAIYVPACTYRAACCRLGRVSMAGPARDFRCCHHRRPHGARVAMGCRS